MGQFLGFGSGTDGVLNITSGTTESPIDSSCFTNGSRSLNAVNASFAAGQIVLIHQTRGTGVGNWEIAQIESYAPGALVLNSNITNTYTDSGSSQAQVRVIPQYSEANISATYTAKAWNTNIGGILAFMCSGKTTISGSISANGTGFNGGLGATEIGSADNGRTGEGSTGDSVDGQTSANGNGGGAGNSSGSNTAGGGGGGNGAAGSAGTASGNTAGSGGSTSGAAALTTMTMGGGGGGGAGGNNSDGGNGGNGGGIILIFSRQLVVTGSITANGSNGSTGTVGGFRASGGGGAGGSIFIKGNDITLGSSLVTASAGTGGAGSVAGGAGGTGRARVEACTVSGSTSPSASSQTGGFSFCSGGGFFQY